MNRTKNEIGTKLTNEIIEKNACQREVISPSISPPRRKAHKVIAGWSSQVARQAHNLKVRGSNPLPATNKSRSRKTAAFAVKVMKSYQVYMIENSVGRRYIGLSENVLIRLEAHNNGMSKWTAKFGPWKLTWTSEEMNLSEAQKLEKLLKSQKGGNGLISMLKKHRGS